MTEVAIPGAEVDGWRIAGLATIGDRPPARAVLVIRANGQWAADVAQFTFAGDLDLFFQSEAGGHFCGPATVARSRADSQPFATSTHLIGTGPLLVVAPSEVPELPDGTMVDGEVVSVVAS